MFHQQTPTTIETQMIVIYIIELTTSHDEFAVSKTLKGPEKLVRCKPRRETVVSCLNSTTTESRMMEHEKSQASFSLSFHPHCDPSPLCVLHVSIETATVTCWNNWAGVMSHRTTTTIPGFSLLLFWFLLNIFFASRFSCFRDGICSGDRGGKSSCKLL